MSTGRDPVAAPDLGAGTNGHEAPAQQMAALTTAAGDHCAACGSPLTSDQRYCVTCGERRGKPRFTLAEQAAMETVTTTGPAPRKGRRPRASASFTLIAGIATLLLAMGVGVLIGHNNAGTQHAASNQPLNVNVNGGGSSAATTPTTAESGSATKSGGRRGSKSKSSKASKAAKSKPSAADTAKASSAASKVLGGSSNTAPATVTQGQSCASTQAGCQNGHFTGNNFFGQ
ncbi:MAG TPA: hypothetical protein VHV28_12085 [Solirubrobacteraceae bacterium]|jgi:hypothetical protein|nr:hypothetical protein [Solirubrobacteraceae bacterium]